MITESMDMLRCHPSALIMRCPPAQPTMTKDWTRTSKSESARQSSDVMQRLSDAIIVRRLRVGLAQGCGVSVAGPNKILLGPPELATKLVGIPIDSPSALLVEGSSSLGLFVLGGHGHQLVLEKCG